MSLVKNAPLRTKREREDIEAQKILRVLTLLRYMMQEPRSALESASYLKVSVRTIYRYLHLFEHVGFRIEKTEGPASYRVFEK